jgi:predicted MFS family arabinose efflux permease
MTILPPGGIAFHMVAYFTDNKIAPGIAAGALSVMALSGAMGNGLWGALAERIQPRLLSVGTMLISACAVALLTQVKGPFTVYVFAVLFGLNARGAAVLTQILLARYFGRRSYGAISSVLIPSTRAAWVSARFLPESPSTSPVTTEPFLRFSWGTIYCLRC